MKQSTEEAIKKRKVILAIMEILLVVGCIVFLWIMSIPKDNFLASTYSYSKVESYEIVDNRITRIMPQTNYETFIKIAKNTLKDEIKDGDIVKVYTDEARTKEVTSGYVTTGMVIVITPKVEKIVDEKKESENTVTQISNANVNASNVTNSMQSNTFNETNTNTISGENQTNTDNLKGQEEEEVVSEEIVYTINVIGDLTGNGDINVTELTRIVRGVVNLKSWEFKEEEKEIVDLNGDDTVDITDIESCINYIVFGDLEVKEKEYTVTFKDYDGSIISQKTDYHKGETVQIPSNPIREADETYSYEFAGWNPEISETVTENAEYTATYEAVANQAQYKVEYYQEKLDGTYELAETENLTGTVGATVKIEPKEYIGFTEDTGNKDRIVSGEILSNGSLTLKLYYNRNQYKLTLEKDENVEGITGAGTYKYGQTVSISATLKEIEGYTITFDKWMSSDTELLSDQAEKETNITMPAGEITLKATTNKKSNQAQYKVEHYKEQLDGSYIVAETETLTGTIGTTVVAVEKEYVGFTEDTENDNRVVSGEILENGNLTLKLYYSRNEYSLILEKDENVESVLGAGTYKYGATVSIDAMLKEVAGYEIKWNKWTSSDTELLADQEEKETNITMPAGELTLTATTTKTAKTDTTYKVEHYKEELDGTYTLAETENLTGTTGEEVTVVSKEYEGFTEDAENDNRVVSGEILGDGSLTLKLFYKRNEYSLTLNKDENIESVLGAGAYKYGATVSINATLKEVAGYEIRWNKWTSSDTELLADQEEKETNITMPAGELTLTATTTKTAKTDTAYKVEHYKEELDGSYTLAETENLTGTTGATVIATAKEYIGFTEDKANSERIEEGRIEADGSLALKLYYNRNTYTITFKNYDGSLVGEEKEYLYGQEIEIPENPTRQEDETYTYTFAGWDKEITIADEDRVYIATYIATYKEYVVTFKQDTGNVISSVVYHYGDTIEIPENPVKEATVEYVYTFSGWTPEVEETVTKSAEYTATYEQQNIKYTFIFYNDDGVTEVARIEDYIWGDNIKLPTSPTKEPTEEINYVFSEWKNLGTEEISATEKVIKFMAQYTEEYFVARLVETDTLEGASYMTLQEAIDAAEEETRTIKLLQDTEESVLVEDVQDVTIDLNGKTVTGAKTGTKAYAIKNYGTLTITDTTEEKNGKIQESARGSVGYGIHNRDGKLTIKSGMIVTDTDIESGSTYAIYNQSEESLIIEGGTITAEARGISSASYGIYNLSGKEITVIGGTVLGNASAESSKGYAIYNATDGVVKVAGGKVKGSTSLASAVSYGIYNAISQNVIISGGIVEVKSDRGVAYGIYNEQGKATQTGGTIDVVASTGYGFYNKKGTIDIEGGTIELNGSTMYGIYNETAGTINVSGGKIDLLGSTAYGIYNRGIMNVTGGSIVSKTENSGYGIYNSSTIDSNISNISISKTNYGIYNSQGNLTVKDVTITTNYGIRMEANNYMIVVESADIVANSYGIYCSYGTVEIGIKDGKVSATQPNIYGETNAIYNDLMSTGKVKYYDGILTGSMVIYGGINEIEDNTQIVVSTNADNKEVARLEAVVQEESVVKIGNTEYPTLADAVDAALTNEEETTEEAIAKAKLASIGEVKLSETEQASNGQILIEAIEDFTISKAVEIPEEANIKIDLAGHKVTTYGKGGITNNGILEIVDTSSAKNAEFISKIGIGITNKGTLIINGGNISSNAYGIYNYSEGNIVINEGTVTGKSDGVYNYSGSNAKITVNGGDITGNNSGIYNYSSSNSVITVNAGTIAGNSYGMYSTSNNSNVIFNVAEGTIEGNSNYGVYMYNGTLNMTGGAITGNSYGVSSYSGTINISGGTITGKNYYGISGDYVKVNMTDGRVVSTSSYNSYSGIHTSNGTIHIEGGEVEGYNGISAGTDATIAIGKKDNNVDANNPLIIGKNYGINVSSAKIYDGKILGRTNAISGSISELEEGKKIQIEDTTYNEEEYKVVNWLDNDVYEDAIIRVGDTEYKSWKEAKEAISNIATNVTETTQITILNDFYMTEELEVKSGQKITLDLNSKTITTMSKIVNRGTLEITDNTEGAEGKILNTNSIGVQNSGNMTITKGTIEAKSYGIYNYSGNLTIGIEDNNVTNIPTIRSESYGVYRNNGSILMFDGTILGKTASDSMIDRTEEEYKVYSYQEDEYYKTVIVELSPMAKIGDVETSLIEAINLAEEGDTIEILRDIQVKEVIVVPENKDIAIDLKGYKISMKSTAVNLEAVLENRGTLNLVGNGGSIYNGTSVGTTVINNGTLKINANIRKENTSRPLINNGTLDLLGGSIYSYYGTVVENNGVFNLKAGWVECGSGSYSSSYYMVKNTAEFNMLGGYIQSYYYKSGIKNEKGSTFTMKAGTIRADAYGIYNDSDNEMNLLGGTITRYYTNASTSYAIYNNTSADINIEGLTINNRYTYGIYNKENGNIAVSNKTNISISGSSYGYGIYNNGTGNIEISGESTVSAKNGNVEYGIYNNGSGNLVIQKSTISANGTNQAYGIMNANEGTVVIANGNMNVESSSGYAYGIYNGVLGTATIERANIIVTTTEGKAYGINNESKNPLIVKEGIIAAGGTQSIGIYSSTSNIILGSKDENVTPEVPVVKADNVGIYINEVDAKFNFYDGQIIGSIPFNTGANTIEGYKIIQYYDKEEETEVAIPVETDYYVLTYTLIGGQKYDSLVIKAGTEITDDILPKIEEGYEFSGWEGLPEVMPEKDVTVYAILVPKTYTITYYVDGEEYDKQENIEYKSSITPIDVPVKEENEFSGWNGIPEVMPAEDIEVRGVFTYFATFYNEDKTEVIKQVPFTINDTSIEEPKITEEEGYIKYWDEYELKAENIEIVLISIEKDTVVNKTQGKSYNNIESAIAEAKTDGTKDELYVFEDLNMETTLIIPKNTNIELDLNGHKIINNSTYCAIDNYGTLTIKNRGEETSSIEISKDDTNVYGIYNRNNVTVDNVNISVISFGDYEGIGIYNQDSAITNVGVKDEVSSNTNPVISTTTFAINNESGTFNFYDGYLIANTAINGEITETEIGHEKKIETIDGKEKCYLEALANGTKLQAIDENGITWNFTVQNKRATNVSYESGDLPENLVIPSTLKGCPVTSLYNGYRKNIFVKSDSASNNTIKKITIPDTVTSVGSYAFYNCTGLIDVVIGNNVKSIGNNSFESCSSLINVKIPDSVTSIGSEAFKYCRGLTTVTIGNNVATIGPFAFYNCNTLSSAKIPDSVTTIGNSAFYNCTSLSNVTIPNSVTNIGESAFYNCSELTEVIIGTSVTSIGNSAFYGCTSLLNIEIPASVTSIGDTVFKNCDSLERIDVNTNNIKYSSKDGVLFDKYKLTIIKYPSNKRDITNYAIPKTVNTISDYTFSGCIGLEIIEIPNSVTSIGNSAFSECSNLENVVIPEGITTIKSYTFSNCSSLTSVTIPTSVTSIESNAFYNCSALTSVGIPENVTSIGSYAFYGCSSLTNVTIPNGITSIKYNTFYNCSSLTNIMMPTSVTSIESNAFYNCSALTSVEIPENVTNIGSSAFYGCSSLTNASIPNSVETLENYTFSNCSNLIRIQIGKGVTKIADNVLDNCNKLERIEVDENNASYSSVDGVLFDKGKLILIRYPSNKSDVSNYEIPSTVETIKNSAFSNCSALESVMIPDSVVSIGNNAFSSCKSLANVIIGNSVTSIGSSAFSSCSALTSVIVPDSVTSMGSYVFYNCSALTSVTIGNGVTGIQSQAFYYCSKLLDVTIGNSVTNIGSHAFSYCSSLTSVMIPDSVTSIGSHAFYESTNLTNVTIGSGINSIGTYAFYYCNNIVDIYIDKIQSEVTFGSSWKSSGYVHYKDCTHSLTNNMQSDTLSIVQTDASSNIEDGKISCRGMYQFKVVDESGEVVKDKLVKIRQQERVDYSSTRTIWIAPNQEGIYTIKNIVRNVTIEEIGELSNGKVVQATDSNGITWNYTYQNGNAENIYYEQGNITSDIELPSELDGHTVISCKENMFSNAMTSRNEIKAITVPESIKSINDSAFSACNNLESINVNENNNYYSSFSGILYDKEQTEIKIVPRAIKEAIIPNGVKSIESNVFSGCTALTNVTIPNSITNIGSSAFSECSNLVDVTISDSITSIEANTFYNCSALTSITIPNNVTSIGSNAFYNCTSLTNVTIGSGVTNISNSTFNSCNKLESINVSVENKTYSSVDGILYNREQTEIIYIPIAIKEVSIPDTIIEIENGVFNSCSSLTSITIGKGVTTIGNIAFSNCSKLENINVSDKNANYSSIEGILYNKRQTTMIMVPRATKEIEVPNTVTKIENYAFYNCDNLEIITIGDSVTDIEIEEVSFYNCSKLKSIDVSNNNTVYSSIDGILYNKEQTRLVKVPKAVGKVLMPATIETIGNYAYNNCTNLSDIIIRDGVKTIESYAFNNCSNLRSITIPNSVTRIESCAFNNCNNLTNVIIGNGVNYIDNDVFNNCTNLNSINVSEDNNSYSSQKGILYNKDQTAIIKVPRKISSLEILNTVTSIADYAFYNCSNLTSITIPETVTTIGDYAFYNCDALTNIIIPDNVTNLGDYVFYDCYRLANVTIGNSVTNIGNYAFYNCSNLTSIEISDSVISIGDYAFYYCYKLKDVTIPEEVTTIGSYAFYYCYNITNITIPEKVTNIGSYAFYNCYNITSITIPEGVTTIRSYVFYNCYRLKEVIIPEKVTSIESYAFYNCYSITSITIPEGVTTIGSYAFYNCSNVMNTTIPESVIDIGEYAFYNCSKLTNVVIPNTMTTIEKGTFSNCTGITSVTIPETITNIDDSAFYNCSQLTSIEIPNSVVRIGNSAFRYGSNLENVIMGDSIEIIGTGAFENCSKLTNIEMSNSVVSIGSSAFSKCSNLTTVTMGSGVETIGDAAFNQCTALTDIVIPSRVTKIGNNTFYGCTKLTKIEMPSNLSTIGDYAFYNCYNLTNSTIPNTVTNIGEYSFYNCYNLTNITIPNRVTSIGKYAFYNCNKVTELAIGNNVKNIGEYAFSSCSSLTSVDIPSSVTNIQGSAFNNCNSLESINVDEENNVYSSKDGILYNKEQTKIIIIPKAIKEVEIPDGILYIEDETFSNCSKLTSVTISDSVTSIGNNAFYNCSNLTSITISNGVRNIENSAFSNCNKLESINVDEGNNVYSSKSGILYNKEQTKMIIVPKAIKEVEISNGIVAIEDETFSTYSSLTSVIIPDSVISIGNNAFYNCSNLATVTIGKGMTNISTSAFNGCNKLEAINVSEENNIYSSVNGILYNKEQTTIVMVPKAIKEVEIPNGIISIQSEAFSNCTSLTSVIIPDSVTSIGEYAFYNCTALISIQIGNGVTSIGDCALDNCNKLETIDVGENNATYSSIDGVLFDKEKQTIIKYPSNKRDVSDYEIPSTVKIIEDNAFYNCSGITNIIIPDSVTSIGNNAFYNCSALTNVTIGDGVASIGDKAFSNCSNLENITVSEANNTYSSINGILYNKEQTVILIIPAKMKGEIIIPESVLSIETEHSYSNNISRTYVKTVEGATSLTLTFDANCYLENNCDYVIISDKDGTSIYNSKGQGNTALANKEITVEGDTVKIYFYTDGSVVYWGFRCSVQANEAEE